MEPFPPGGRPPLVKDFERAVVETAAALVEGPPAVTVEPAPPVPPVVAGGELTVEEREAFLAEIEIVDPDGRKRKVPLWQHQACTHCGGLHVRACPRVRRMEFGPGNTLTAIEFWKAGEWPDTGVVWPEQILAEPMPTESPEEGS